MSLAKMTRYKIIKLIISVSLLAIFAILTLPGISDSIQKKELTLCHSNKVKIARAYTTYQDNGGKMDLNTFLKFANYKKYLKQELVCPSYDGTKSKYSAKNGDIFCPYHPEDIVYAGKSVAKTLALKKETTKLKKIAKIYNQVIKECNTPDKRCGTLLRKAFYKACETEKIDRKVSQVLLDELGLLETKPLYWDADYYSPTKMVLYYARPKDSATYWNASLALPENGRIYVSLGMDGKSVRNNVGTVVRNTTYAEIEAKLITNGFTFSGKTLDLND